MRCILILLWGNQRSCMGQEVHGTKTAVSQRVSGSSLSHMRRNYFHSLELWLTRLTHTHTYSMLCGNWVHTYSSCCLEILPRKDANAQPQDYQALGLSRHPAAISAVPGSKSIQCSANNFSTHTFFLPTLCIYHLKETYNPFFEQAKSNP